MEADRYLQFGDFTLNTTQRLLYRAEERLRIAPKLLELLTLLAERKGAVVAHAEIMRRLWPNTVVEECGLARNVSLLRKHLASMSSTDYIENIPRVGYRLMVEVKEGSEPVTQANCVAEGSLTESSSEEIKEIGEHALPTVIIAPRQSLSRRSRAWLLFPLLSLFGLMALVSGHGGSVREQPWRSTQLTTNAAALPIISSAVSPDGRYLAYAERSETNIGVFVRLLSSNRSHELQSLPSVVPSSIQWFDDNVHLLLSGYDSNSRRYIAWSVSVLGDSPVILLDDAYKPSLSPDSNSIAFTRKNSELWIADATGEAARLFATAPDGSRFRLQPQFSADGQYLLIGRTTLKPFSPVIEMHRVADGTRTLLFDPLGQVVRDAFLLQNGELLVALGMGYEQTRLVSMRVDFARGRVSDKQTLMDIEGEIYGLRGSADESLVTAIQARAQTDVYVAELDSSGTALQNVRRLTLDDAWDRPSSWLADSRTILFHSKRQATKGIYAQRIDALHASPLVVDEHHNIYPVASPDQQWLWYFSKPAEHSSDPPVTLMRKPLAGGPAQAFGTRHDDWRGLRCATSGRCIRAEHEQNQVVFFSFDPHDGSGRELARAAWTVPYAYFSWDISPGGDRIAMVDRSKDAIVILALDSVPAQRSDLHVEGFQSIQALSWDAKGSGFYVACFDEDDHTTLHVSLKGEVTVMRHQPLNIGGWMSPSPDGRYVMLADWTKASNVLLFERR